MATIENRKFVRPRFQLIESDGNHLFTTRSTRRDYLVRKDGSTYVREDRFEWLVDVFDTCNRAMWVIWFQDKERKKERRCATRK